MFRYSRLTSRDEIYYRSFNAVKNKLLHNRYHFNNTTSPRGQLKDLKDYLIDTTNTTELVNRDIVIEDNSFIRCPHCVQYANYFTNESFYISHVSVVHDTIRIRDDDGAIII